MLGIESSALFFLQRVTLQENGRLTRLLSSQHPILRFILSGSSKSGAAPQGGTNQELRVTTAQAVPSLPSAVSLVWTAWAERHVLLTGPADSFSQSEGISWVQGLSREFSQKQEEVSPETRLGTRLQNRSKVHHQETGLKTGTSVM